MTALYIILALAAGFVFGVLATALAAMAGDKNRRENEQRDDF